MDDPEKKHFALLNALPLQWEQIIGASALALLMSGEKLELEGASNPAFYRGSALVRQIEQRVLLA